MTDIEISDKNISYALQTLSGFAPEDIECDDFDIAVNDDQFANFSIVRSAQLGHECIERLIKENKTLKSQLHDLFEHVSGVSVSEYKPEQMPYLADYIIGQAEADNFCIERLKADKAELLIALDQSEMLNQHENPGNGELLSLLSEINAYLNFNEKTYISNSSILHKQISDMLKKHKGATNG